MKELVLLHSYEDKVYLEKKSLRLLVESLYGVCLTDFLVHYTLKDTDRVMEEVRRNGLKCY